MDDELHTITKPQDMRRRMQEIASLGAMRDGKPDFVGVIVSACLRAGRYEGWSGEDTYTILAWQLMHAANRYGRLVHEAAVMAPPPRVIAANVGGDVRSILLRAREAIDGIIVEGGSAKGKHVYGTLLRDISAVLETLPPCQ